MSLRSWLRAAGWPLNLTTGNYANTGASFGGQPYSGLLRETVGPVKESAFLPAIAAYLAGDLITAFVVGAALAFVMHSGVAAILVIMTLVQLDAIPFVAGFAILLGANLGNGFIPVWLARGAAVAAGRGAEMVPTMVDYFSEAFRSGRDIAKAM